MAVSAKHFSVDPAQPIDIVLGKTGLPAEEPVTMGQIFRATCSKYPDAPALAVKEGDSWNKVSYSEYYNLCIKAAKSFIKLGLEPLHGVGIIGFNSAEWFISSIGCVFAGGLSSGIYATSSPEACQYILNDCKANVVVVENDRQLQKILKVRDELPHLKAIVQYKDKLTGSYPNVYEWEQFMKLGEGTDNSVVEDKISAQKPTECAYLIYTSGTTGSPKGVMITHDNAVWSTKSIAKTFEVFEPGDRLVSYLPLSHIAGLLVDMIMPLYIGSTVYFAQPDALKGSLGETLRDVQPNLFVGVPRVWEKFMEKLLPMLPPPGSGPPPSAEVMKAIQAKVSAGLGLAKCKLMITCAAPISIEVLKFFAKLGIEIAEVWGMTEVSGPGTATSKHLPNQWKMGSLGKAFVGMEIKIDGPSPTTGDGEICLRGRNVMMGYLNKLDKTQETIDSEGWLHSGDIGRIDEDGFLYITGRIKEIIITSGGENIAPVPIEDTLKKHAPFLSNVILIGDKRKFVSCLVTMKVDMDPSTGAPTNKLTEEAVKILSSLGSSSTTVTDIIDKKDEVVYAAIQKAIDSTNEQAVSNAQKVQKFTILKDDVSIPGGELGPTMKLKRFYVLDKYKEVIDKMYD